MGIGRIIIGIIILGVGGVSWLGTLYDNIPQPDETVSIPQILNFDIFIELLINSIIVGVGIWFLSWGINSCKSPR